MKSLKKVKMKKVKDLLSSKEEVKEVRASLERRTANDFKEFAKSKQKMQELAHLMVLD